MEASDGEEEKSQESCEEKEEVDRRSRQTRPIASAIEKAGLGTGRESCGETGCADDGSASSRAFRKGRARGRTCPDTPWQLGRSPEQRALSGL